MALSLLISVAVIHLAAMASPGPNVLLVAQTAMARSQRAAVAAALGVASAAALLAAASALGLGLVLERAVWLRHALQLAGGAYLVFLGIQIWRSAPAPPIALDPESPGGRPGRDGRRRHYLRGFLTNLTNPKAAVFYGSVLAAVLAPVDSSWIRFAAVGVIAVNAAWWHCLIAVGFGRPEVRRAYRRVKHVADRVVGGALAAIGARLAAAPLLRG